MNSPIDAKTSDGVLHITLNRPEKKNALNTAMYQTLADTINAANTDDGCRVILISAAGDGFCAGNDLADFVDNKPTGMSSPVFQFMMALVNVEKPMIAAVNGPAVGIGTTMLLHCDMVFAADDAMFMLPFVNLGVCAEAGSSLLLPMLCGRQKASELLLNGDPFNVTQAKDIGLVNRVTTLDRLHQTAMEQATKLAAKPAQALIATRRLIITPLKDQLISVIQQEAEQFIDLLNSDQSQRLIQKFLQR